MKLQGIVNSSLLLLVLSAPSIAATHAAKHHVDYKGMAIAAAPVSGFAGWSAGLGVGVNSYSMNTTVISESQTFATPFLSGVNGNVIASDGRANVFKFGPMANVFAGYGYLNDIYYIGANAGLNFVGAKTLNANQTNSSNINTTYTDVVDTAVIDEINTLTTQTKVTRSWLEPFIDLKVGGLITPNTLAYAIGGVSLDSVVVRSITTYATSASILTIGGPIPPQTSGSSIALLNYSKQRNLVGLRLGAGTETLLTPNFGVSAQYVYTFFPTFNANGATDADISICDPASGCQTTPGTVTNTTRTELNDQQVLVEFIYHM